MIRHFVALRFRNEVSAADKQALYDALAGLSGLIPGILGFRPFANISVELPLVRGFNDGFWFDFRDLSVRDAYLADATHQVIGARIVAALEGGPDGVFVCDMDMG